MALYSHHLHRFSFEKARIPFRYKAVNGYLDGLIKKIEGYGLKLPQIDFSKRRNAIYQI